MANFFNGDKYDRDEIENHQRFNKDDFAGEKDWRKIWSPDFSSKKAERQEAEG